MRPKSSAGRIVHDSSIQPYENNNNNNNLHVSDNMNVNVGVSGDVGMRESLYEGSMGSLSHDVMSKGGVKANAREEIQQLRLELETLKNEKRLEDVSYYFIDDLNMLLSLFMLNI